MNVALSQWYGAGERVWGNVTYQVTLGGQSGMVQAIYTNGSPTQTWDLQWTPPAYLGTTGATLTNLGPNPILSGSPGTSGIYGDLVQMLNGPATYTYNSGTDADYPPFPFPTSCEKSDLNPLKRINGGVGLNPINPANGNLHRSVVDITTFGAAPISFERIYNSRAQNFGTNYRDFGTDTGWTHNWSYELRRLASQTNGVNDFRLRYPDGRDHVFKATTGAGTEFIPPPHSGDRLLRWSGTLVGYTLVVPDGSKLEFQQSGTAAYDLKSKTDGKSFVWTITHDANQKVERITNNFGRWIELERSVVGGLEVVTKVTTDDAREVDYGYSAWSPTSEQTLTSVDYPGGESAAYTWVGGDSLTMGRPLLGTADDPLYGGAGARTKYVYNYSFTVNDGSGPYLLTGVVKEERNLVSDQVIVSLPDGCGPYPKILEGNGTEITRKYANGRLVESRDGEGRATKYVYGSVNKGFLIAAVEPNGGTTSILRDSVGRVKLVGDAEENFESRTYSASGFEVTHTGKRGYKTSTARDGSNRPTRVDYPDSTYETWTYNSNGLPLTHRLRNSGTLVYTYTAGGNVDTLTDAENNTWTYTYDASGQPATVTDPRSNTTTYAYDWRGQILSITHPDTKVRSFEYDDYGNCTKVTDELGKETDYTYNEYNRVETATDPLNRTTSYEYGREPGCSSCGFSSVVTEITLPSGRTIEFTYDLSWKILTRVDAPGTADEATTTFAYNAGGDLASVTNGENETASFTYDLLHRKLTSTDPLSSTTTWTYDPNGNTLTQKLADNSLTTYEYDAMNRLKKVIDPLSQVTEFTYNGGDKPLTLKDARTNIYSFEYDKRNLQTKKIYPDTSYQQWTYDGARNVATYRTRANDVLTITSDNRNRAAILDWSGSLTPDVSRTYDDVGRLLTVDNANAEITFTYDDAGQLRTEEQKILVPNLTKTVAYTYNADGLRATLTYPDTKSFTYSYTQRNQLSEIEFNLLMLNPLVAYTYDLAGRRTLREMNNSGETEYTYDDVGRITLIEQKNAGGTFDRRDYGYTVVNNRKWEKRDSLLGDAYAYDVTGQLTSVKYDAATPDGTPASPMAQTAFDFDAVGNREVVTQTTGTGAPVNTSYTANSLNQYTAVSALVDIDHDSNGNLSYLCDSGGDRIFYYDAANRLLGSSGSIPAAYDEEFLYDGLNRIVTHWRNGVPFHRVYDTDWNVVEEYDNSGTQVAAMAYGAGTDEPIFRWAAGFILSYYHQDALGNVTALTDLSGIPVESYRYDAYGTPTIYDPFLSIRAVSFFGNPYLFTGREFVAETGLYLYRNRVYSPELGRFLQTDPIGFQAGDVNLYRYVSNNPINLIDPLGFSSKGVFNLATGMMQFSNTEGGTIKVNDVFSGDGPGRNNPEYQHVIDRGPIPIGQYYIDEADQYGWYRLYSINEDGSITPYKDVLSPDGKLVRRQDFFLHPGNESLGCTTVPRDSGQFDGLKKFLDSSPPVIIHQNGKANKFLGTLSVVFDKL